MKIDIHTHILPTQWPDLEKKYGYKGWIKMIHNKETNTASLYKDTGEFFRSINQNCWDIDVRVEQMEKSSVDLQVLSTVPVMFNYWAKAEDTLNFCKFLNDDIANSISKYPNKFIGLGTIPLQDSELCVEEIKRLKLTKGMCGIEIGTHVNDQDFNSSFFDPIFKTCEDLDMCIFVHPWYMPTDGRYNKFWFPMLIGMPQETTMALTSLLLGGVFLKYPKLRICFSHGGGSFPYTVGRIDHGYNVNPSVCATSCNLCPSKFIGKFYTDSIVHNSDSLDFLIKVIGQDKVCMGSDYPFILGEHHPGNMIENSFLSTSIKEKLLFNNALEFLNISHSMSF